MQNKKRTNAHNGAPLHGGAAAVCVLCSLLLFSCACAHVWRLNVSSDFKKTDEVK